MDSGAVMEAALCLEGCQGQVVYRSSASHRMEILRSLQYVFDVLLQHCLPLSPVAPAFPHIATQIFLIGCRLFAADVLHGDSV